MNWVIFDRRLWYLLIISVWLSSSLNVNNVTEIRIGILLAQTMSDSVTISDWKSGEYYASAFKIAVEEVNQNSQLLPGYKLEYVYSDTKCLEGDAVTSFHDQIFRKNVTGVIGLGCSKCDCLAKYAGFANIIMISHVSAPAGTKITHYKF